MCGPKDIILVKTKGGSRSRVVNATVVIPKNQLHRPRKWVGLENRSYAFQIRVPVMNYLVAALNYVSRIIPRTISKVSWNDSNGKLSSMDQMPQHHLPGENLRILRRRANSPSSVINLLCIK
jgi:hypothetical protein